MRALKYLSEGSTAIQDVEEPEIKNENEVLLRVLLAAVCGSDLHMTSVPQKHPCDPGTTLGHECVAEVVELGTGVTGYKAGDRVVIEPIISCGHCPSCKRGNYNLCDDLRGLGVVADGVFAEYVVVTEDRLYPISKELSVNKAVFTEMMSCIMNGVKRLDIVPGASIVVFGAGPIGLGTAEIVKAAGAGKVVVTENNQDRIALAQKASSADYILDSSDKGVYEEIKKIVSDEGADIVIDTVGVLFPEAIQTVRRGGQIYLFGMNDQVVREIKENDIVRNELTVISSYSVQSGSFPAAIKMLETGMVDPEPLLTEIVTLDELEDAMDRCRVGQAIKVAVKF